MEGEVIDAVSYFFWFLDASCAVLAVACFAIAAIAARVSDRGRRRRVRIVISVLIFAEMIGLTAWRFQSWSVVGGMIVICAYPLFVIVRHWNRRHE